MTVDAVFREKCIESNKKEYGLRYESLRFMTDDEAAEAQKKRSDLLVCLENKVEWGFSGTKADCGNLSQGCRLCGAGQWSCLFVNNLCNASCFYCPSSQEEKSVPATNTVMFAAPEEYAAYLKKFGFTGCSISGGEPLLTPKLTLSYIRAVKKAFGSSIYMWMYTNGTLVTDEILINLRDAGLDEIRFDIGAAGYRLDKLKAACGVIPVVTVEIPAVPEDVELMKKLMSELADIGVKHLNLHQLRLTPHNFSEMIKRNYTYIHGESVAVLESEFAALELMKHAKESGIDLPVNYCSFVYKNRFQGLASRRRNAAFVLREGEEITENGYIRTFAEKDAGRSVTYYQARQLSSVSYRNPFTEVKLTKSKKVAIERLKASAELPEENPERGRFERVAEGLQNYF
jgi:pyruvate formate-lyase activating enzyme-like uncharacterized protein